MTWYRVQTCEKWAGKFKGWQFVYRLRYDGLDYIGSTVNALERFRHWRSLLKKPEAKVQVLCICPNAEYRLALEERAIAAYDTFHNGHNRTRTGKGGGRKGHVFSEAEKAHLSKLHTGFRHSTETRIYLSVIGLGQKRAVGKRTDESKLRMSIAAKNRNVERTKKICPWCGSLFMGHSRMLFCKKLCTKDFHNFYHNAVARGSERRSMFPETKDEVLAFARAIEETV